jgi:glycosyltransferase involved in cell wall biosynthesis
LLIRVLFIVPGYYPCIGGVEYVVKSISESLIRMGHEVTVIAGEPSIGEPREEEVNGVRVARWPTWSPNGAYHFPRRRSELKLYLEKTASGVDMVHVHSIHAIFTVYSGLVVGERISGVKLVVTPHYHGGGHTILRRILWVPWEFTVSRLLDRASVVHAVSKREASLLDFHYQGIKNKIIVIPNGVEEDVFNYKWQGRDSDYIVYSGRIEKYKRLELAVDVARTLGVKLLVIGRGPYRSRLERYAEEKYRGMVEFLDHQPREQYLELLSRARYAVNPSKHEAYSIFTAEALAIGTPAIVSREIAENLEAQAKPLTKDLVMVEKAPIKTWSEVLLTYVEELYNVKE